MTLLEQLSGSGDDVAIPGHVLSAPRITELFDAEAQVARAYAVRVHQCCIALGANSAAAQDVMLRQMTNNLSSSTASGGFEFHNWMFSAEGTLYLGWLCLRIKEPNLKQDEAAALVRDHPASIPAIWKAWGSGSPLLLTPTTK